MVKKHRRKSAANPEPQSMLWRGLAPQSRIRRSLGFIRELQPQSFDTRLIEGPWIADGVGLSTVRLNSSEVSEKYCKSTGSLFVSLPPPHLKIEARQTSTFGRNQPLPSIRVSDERPCGSRWPWSAKSVRWLQAGIDPKQPLDASPSLNG